MKNELTAKRIAIAIGLNDNISQRELAEKSGLKESSISQYVRGSHKPGNVSAGKLAKVLSVSPVWLMGFDVPMREEEKVVQMHCEMIPIIGRVCAGNGSVAFEECLGRLPVKESEKGCFALTIRGDSMTPLLLDGDTVIVDPDAEINDNDIVVAMINDEDASCKRIRKYDKGYALIPENNQYRPIFVMDEKTESEIRIIGKAIEARKEL